MTAQTIEATSPEAQPLRPFGLTKAVPVTAPDTATTAPVLTLCPERQISVTEDGIPFIHEPSMASEFMTKQQTREDSQLDESTDNDKD
ncbi:putative ATP-grasp-modified RiPP [Streptomyces sulphureus]|uniref:putative ATP-grasp-modified RiPP n=1 Tax=Streptomyces sulphureus TaxID=47758 RepID=UPI0003801F53|nr:putative ATP-grasp-modified RiPP [Streptomyces sulphureus]